MLGGLGAAGDVVEMFCAEKPPMQRLPLVTEVVLTFTCPVIGWILFPDTGHYGDADWSDL